TVVPPPPAPRPPGPVPPPSALLAVPPAPGRPSHTPPALAPHRLSRASTARRRCGPVCLPWPSWPLPGLAVRRSAGRTPPARLCCAASSSQPTATPAPRGSHPDGSHWTALCLRTFLG